MYFADCKKTPYFLILPLIFTIPKKLLLSFEFYSIFSWAGGRLPFWKNPSEGSVHNTILWWLLYIHKYWSEMRYLLNHQERSSAWMTSSWSMNSSMKNSWRKRRRLHWTQRTQRTATQVSLVTTFIGQRNNYLTQVIVTGVHSRLSEVAVPAPCHKLSLL